MFSESAQNPESFALGWTPGVTPFLEPSERAWRLERGTDLVVQLHLTPSGKAERVGLSVGFFFSDVPPTRTSVDIKLGSKTIDIPPGDASYTVEDRFVLPADVEVLSVYPHAHDLAKDMKAFATLPDGSIRWLIWIKDWDFNWQDQYRYDPPLFLPRGTTLTMQYRYDNSSSNPRNPTQPPSRVVHGPQSSDEMGDLWLRLLPRTTADAASLARSFVQHELASEIAGAERKVSRDPKSATWLNVLGIRYVEGGRIDDGIARLRDALGSRPITPRRTAIWHMRSGFRAATAEALGHFQEAARLAPGNDRIHFNLAGALQDRNDLEAAIRHYGAGLALNPDAADAHNGLGTALGSIGRLEEAARHFRIAIEIEPDLADAKKNLALLAELLKQ